MPPCFLTTFSCFPSRRFTFLALALAIALCAVSAFGQSKGGSAPHFDIRDAEQKARRLSASAKGEEPAAVEARIEQATGRFVAPGGRTLTYARGRFGLPKTLNAGGAALSLPRVGAPREAALAFLRASRRAFPFRADEIDALIVAHETKAGRLGVVRFQQTLGGLPVYGGRISVAVDAQGRVVQVSSGEAAPGLTLGPDAQLSPMDAALAALRRLGAEGLDSLDDAGSAGGGRALFRVPGAPNLPPAAVDAVVFPMASGEGRRAWRVIAGYGRGSREMVIDAADGRLLESVSLVRRLGSARVFTNSPLQPRELVDFPTGWLPEGGGVTTGNNADAFVDGDLDDAPDPLTGGGLEDGRATADDSGLFDHPAGDGFDFEPSHAAAAVTNAFYFANVAHDYFYALGFQEADGALQASNGPRGGVPGDPVHLAVGLDPLFSSPETSVAPDGMSSTIRLPPDLLDDGISHSAYDGDTVIHEYAHNVSDRLAGGPDDVSCIGFSVQESAISEGVSDYFAASFFDDPVISEYVGGPETGIRLAALNDNPRTYESLGAPYFEEHADGEIVAAILWEIRTALGAAVTDELVLDALKLLPCEPSFVDLRDALLTAGGETHRAALWRIFAPRGLGMSARGADSDTEAYDTLFDAAFDLPEDLTTGANRPPRFLSTPGDFAIANEQFIYTARAEDPNGDPLTFRLLDGPEDATFDTATGRLSYRGKFVSQRVLIEATDGKGGRTVHGLLIFGVALLTPGRSFGISGDRYSSGQGLILVDGAKEALQVTTRGGQGNPDITVFGPERDFFGERIGPNETVTIPNPAFPFFYFIRVDGFRAYERVTLLASFVSSTPAEIGSPIGPVGGATSSETFYKITVPPGTPRLRITSAGDSGDVDLALAEGRLPPCYVELGVFPFCEADFVSEEIGNFETIEVMNPAAGDWFLNLQAYEAYSGVRVNIRTSAGAIELTAATDAAAFGELIASGGIGTLFGSGFTDQTLEAGSLPLPTTLAGVQVFVDGVPAPLFYVSPTQINFQMPVGAGTGAVRIVVVNGDELSGFVTAVVQTQVPRMFSYTPADGIATPVVTHADGSVVTPENPAAPGEVLVGYLTGAAIAPQPVDGEAAAADPLSLTVDPAVVTIGGASATTLFSGATPGFVGLIQVNFQLPAELPQGSRLTLVIQFGDAATRPLSLPVGP